jgi:ankyrin repeat-rich membrane spanning protein
MHTRSFILSSVAVAGLLGGSARVQAGGPGEELIKAARKGDRGKAASLLQQGVPVDAQDKDGKTALWEASRHDHGEIVALLLEHDAQVDLASKDGETPLLQAHRQGETRVS